MKCVAAILAALLLILPAGCRRQDAPNGSPSGPAPAAMPPTLPWADARTGDTVRIRNAGEQTIVTTFQVIAADKATLTLRKTVQLEGTVTTDDDAAHPRAYDPLGLLASQKAKRQAPQTLAIDGQSLPCEVFDTPATASQPARRVFLCPQVPGLLVRLQVQQAGQWRTVSELVSFTRG